MYRQQRTSLLTSTIVLAWLLTAILGAVSASADERTIKEHFVELDTNSDRVIDRSEAAADDGLLEEFNSTDVNRDAYISPSEFVSYSMEVGKAPAGKPVESWFTVPAHKPE